MDSSIEIVVKHSKSIESVLTEKFSAVGKGLTEKVKSIEYDLPSELVSKIKYVAKTRNKVVHEESYNFVNKEAFLNICSDVIEQLNTLEPFEVKHEPEFWVSAPPKPSSLSLFTLIIGVIVVGYFLMMLTAGAWTFLSYITGEKVAFLGGIVTYLILLAIFINRQLIKLKKAKVEAGSNWSFYKDKFVINVCGDDQREINIPFSTIKYVGLDSASPKAIKIASVDRGVNEEFFLKPSDSNVCVKDVCQKVHALVFRGNSPLHPNEHRHTDHKVSVKTVAAAAAVTSGAFGINDHDSYDDSLTVEFGELTVNPATGLPMVGGVDSVGNPYGADLSNNGFNDDVGSSFESTSFDIIDDSFSSGMDDSFSSEKI